MELVNIPKFIDDPSYRYRREVFSVVHSAVNDGITIINNIETVCKQIYRTPKDLLSYLQKELGTRGSIKKKESIRDKDRLILNGTWQKEDLEMRLEKYILANVRCKKCGIPEVVAVKHKKSIIYRCQACGT